MNWRAVDWEAVAFVMMMLFVYGYIAWHLVGWLEKMGWI